MARIYSYLLALGISLTLAACGGNGPTGPSGTGGGSTTSGSTGGNQGPVVTLSNGSMSGTIDGARWDATVAIVVVNGPGNRGNLGSLAISGVDSLQRQISMGVGHRGAGTYTTAADQVGLGYLEGLTRNAWSADRPEVAPGSSGTVTLTTLTAARAAGTFSFTAVASPSTGATGTRTVTNGRFDVTF